jgi:hypothetical protein
MKRSDIALIKDEEVNGKVGYTCPTVLRGLVRMTRLSRRAPPPGTELRGCLFNNNNPTALFILKIIIIIINMKKKMVLESEKILFVVIFFYLNNNKE